MLQISKKQMDAIGREMRKSFERRMLKHVEEKFPEKMKDIATEERNIIIKESIKKSESYGVNYKYDIQRFIEFYIIYGEQLDRSSQAPWLGQILRRTDLGSTAKMDLIESQELEMLRGRS